jgi:Holliday junction resolvase RusA-like endonuclease
MTKKTVVFEEGWADELMEDTGMTQEDVDNLMRGIKQVLESDTIIEDSTPIDEEEFLEIVANRKKHTRH